AYVQESLDAGVVFFSLASLFPAEQGGSGTFPSFYTKENPLVEGGLQTSSRLELVVKVGDTPLPGDLNDDGVVDRADLGILLAQWGVTGSGDLHGDSIVDGSDLGLLLGAWSA